MRLHARKKKLERASQIQEENSEAYTWTESERRRILGELGIRCAKCPDCLQEIYSHDLLSSDDRPTLTRIDPNGNKTSFWIHDELAGYLASALEKGGSLCGDYYLCGLEICRYRIEIPKKNTKYEFFPQMLPWAKAEVSEALRSRLVARSDSE